MSRVVYQGQVYSPSQVHPSRITSVPDPSSYFCCLSVKMRLLHILAACILAPITSLAAPAGDQSMSGFFQQYKRENLCNLKSPPSLCQPNSSVTVAETALRAYKFYRAFVVDGDPRTMFSLIDSSYIVRSFLSSRQICLAACCGDMDLIR